MPLKSGVLTPDGRLSPGFDLADASIDLGLNSQYEMHKDHVITVLFKAIESSFRSVRYHLEQL